MKPEVAVPTIALAGDWPARGPGKRKVFRARPINGCTGLQTRHSHGAEEPRNLSLRHRIHVDGRRHGCNPADPLRAVKLFGMDGKRQGIQPLKQRGSRRIEILIADAVNPGSAGGASSLPAALGENLVERDAVARSAPGRDEDIRVQSRDFFGGNLLSRSAEKLTSRSVHKFCNPGLRRDQGLAPFFAEYLRPR